MANQGYALKCESCDYDHEYAKCLSNEPVIQQMINRIIDNAPLILHDNILTGHVHLHYHAEKKSVIFMLDGVSVKRSHVL